MYVHAYQSYVWNAIVSERIRMHGADKPAVGDLVFDEVSSSKAEGEDEAVYLLELKEESIMSFLAVDLLESGVLDVLCYLFLLGESEEAIALDA